MLFFICLLLIALIVILQLKVSKISGSNNSADDAKAEGVSAQHVGRGIDCRRTEAKEESAFQKIFLGNLFNKIGAVAIIVALIFFIKLVSTMIVITPLVKFISAYVCGLFMVGSALNMHKKENMKSFSEVLLGTGFATLFITTFCGYSIFKILTPVYAVLIGGLLLFATYYVADRMKTYSMIAIGLIGGYLTPFLSGVESTVILAFLVFLNMVSLVYTLKNTKIRFLNIVNLILTVLIMMTYGFLGTVEVGYPIALWAVYILYDILRDKTSAIDTTVCWINYFVLTIFTLWYSFGNHQMLGIIFGVSAVGYFMLSMLSRFQKNTLYRHYDHCVLINLWLFVLIEASDVYSIIAWSLIGLVLSYLISYHKYEYLKPAMWWYFASMFFGAIVLNINGEWCLFAGYKPILNFRTLCFGVPVLSMLGSSLLMKKDFKISANFLTLSAMSMFYLYLLGEVNSLLTYFSGSYKGVIADMPFARLMVVLMLGFIYSLHSRLLYKSSGFELFNVLGIVTGIVTFVTLVCCSYYYPNGYMIFLNLRCAAYILGIATFVAYARWTNLDAYKYLAIVAGFLMIHCESAGVKYIWGDTFQYVISLSWVIYSGIITILGILKSKNYLTISGIVLSILTVLRILFVDLPSVDNVYKLIICLVLGVEFMFISYLYTVKNKQ